MTRASCTHVAPAERILNALLVDDPDDSLQTLARDVARLCNRDIGSVRLAPLRCHLEPATAAKQEPDPQLTLDLE